MNIGRTEKYIYRILNKRCAHFSLLDPDPSKVRLNQIDEASKTLRRLGTDAILVGGSSNMKTSFVDKCIRIIKKNYGFPIILYPGNLLGLSKYADAILFMSLLNSKDPLWITGMQKEGAHAIKKYKIEPISMAYLIVEPGMKAGKVGKAKLLKNPKEAARFALAAQYMGMRFVYLDAGSGAYKPVPTKMIKLAKKTIDIPLIVGGGIRNKESAKKAIKAGADIIVTGTILEDGTEDNIKSIIETVKKS